MSSSHPDLHGRAIGESAQDYLDAVLGAVGAALAASARAQRDATRDLAISPLERRSRLEQLIEDLVASGGKMLRPRLAFLGHLAVATATSCCTDEAPGAQHAAGGPARSCTDTIAAAATSPALVALGAAFELLHVFGLLQDDVMDESATRRGRPTAHERLAAGDPWIGADAAGYRSGSDGARFGESVAILAGDLAFTLAQRQVRRLPEAVTDAWDETVVELVQGQRLDLVFAAEGRVDVASTRRVAAMKSGAYTFTRPLELGALLAHETQARPRGGRAAVTDDTNGRDARGDRDDSDDMAGGAPDYLRRIGEHLGAAFALSDDILGIWGDPTVTGKPAGDDLSQRKPSTVLGLADRATRGEVGRALRSLPGPPTPRQVARLVEVMDRAGVREEAERHVAAHIAGARAELGHVRCVHVRAELADVADRLLHRPA